jgi:hypothetical protein
MLISSLPGGVVLGKLARLVEHKRTPLPPEREPFLQILYTMFGSKTRILFWPLMYRHHYVCENFLFCRN